MKSILLIDDDELLVEGLKRLLERNGYHIRTARDGREGIALLDTVGADVVITDIYMEGMEGLETITHLKSRPNPVTVIAISGGHPAMDFDCLEIAQRLGADRVLQKPVRVENLLATLRALEVV